MLVREERIEAELAGDNHLVPDNLLVGGEEQGAGAGVALPEGLDQRGVGRMGAPVAPAAVLEGKQAGRDEQLCVDGAAPP